MNNTSPDIELIKLRISVARIAQVLGVDNKLEVTDKTAAELTIKAISDQRGWNDLAGLCVDQITGSAHVPTN